MTRASTAGCTALGRPDPPGADVPGGVYLCQVRDELSCGACCGLYNLPAADETALARTLKRRSEAFARVPRQIDAVADFGRRILEEIADRQPISGFHHCPFVGLIGERMSRVGCLLHPLAPQNRGIDLRGLSHYGGMACRIYFCPSHESLEPAWKRIVQQTVGTWHLYGLVITEDELLAGLFQLIEARLGRPVTEEGILSNPDCARAMTTLLRLKCDWPYRPPGVPGPVNYFFKDRGRTRPPVAYPPGRTAPPELDAIFRALGAAFESESALADAEQRIRRPIDAIVERLRR